MTLYDRMNLPNDSSPMDNVAFNNPLRNNCPNVKSVLPGLTQMATPSNERVV
jgi:hypothetical protein